MSRRIIPNTSSRFEGNFVSRGRSNVNNSNIITGNYGSASANYTTNQLGETEVDIKNIYSIAKYIPVNEIERNALYRQIYQFDVIAGASVELYINLLWSDIELSNIRDKHILKVYEESIDNIKLVNQLNWLTHDYLVLGKFCAHLIFNETTGLWTDLIQHNPDHITVTPVPFINAAPLITLTPPNELKSLSKRILNSNLDVNIDENMREMLTTIVESKNITLPESNTIYFPRKSGSNDYIGTSLYSRIISLIMLESALMNSNIINAYRRAGPLRIITPPEDSYYTTEQLNDLSLAFMEADEDPTGSTLVVREPMNIETFNGGDAQWRVFDDWDSIQSSKLKALGFSDAFLDGDNNYATTEITLSIFLERVKGLQNLITREFIINKICLNLAKAHGFIKRKKADLDHNVRTSSKTGISDYILPEIKWSQSLAPFADSNKIEFLEKAEEKGIPISLKTWAYATGVDLNSEKEMLESDEIERSEIEKYLKNRSSDDDDMIGDMGDMGDMGDGAQNSQIFEGDLNPYNFKLLSYNKIIKGLKYLYTGKDISNIFPTNYIILFNFYIYLKGIHKPTFNMETIAYIKTKIITLDIESDAKLYSFLVVKWKELAKTLTSKKKSNTLNKKQNKRITKKKITLEMNNVEDVEDEIDNFDLSKKAKITYKNHVNQFKDQIKTFLDKSERNNKKVSLDDEGNVVRPTKPTKNTKVKTDKYKIKIGS